MIYLMPIDECPRCGTRTPRIVSHRCTEQEEEGRIGDELAAEFQTWIASQVAASSARSGSAQAAIDLRGAISGEPDLSATAKRHLIGLVADLRRPSRRTP